MEAMLIYLAKYFNDWNIWHCISSIMYMSICYIWGYFVLEVCNGVFTSVF